MWQLGENRNPPFIRLGGTRDNTIELYLRTLQNRTGCIKHQRIDPTVSGRRQRRRISGFRGDLDFQRRDDAFDRRLCELPLDVTVVDATERDGWPDRSGICD